jgi:hypothetical protein
MPLLVYFELNDEEVTPHQHVIRALGGPVFNALALPIWWLVRRLAPPESMGRDVGQAGTWMNAFLLAAGLTPIPGLDGSVILKWSVVARGRTLEEAEEVVRKVNGPTAVGMGVLSAMAFKRKKRLVGVFAAMFAVLSALIFTGRLKESG